MNGRRVFIIGIGIVVLFGISRVVAEPYNISGDCMEPAYKDGDLHFLNHITGYVRNYRIGDVVLYKHEERVWISRIVARGGDTIKITDGQIVVNGEILPDQEDIVRSWSGWKYGKFALDETLQVPEDQFYMLSDKLSAQHDDSRVFGTIANDMILGLIWL